MKLNKAKRYATKTITFTNTFHSLWSQPDYLFWSVWVLMHLLTNSRKVNSNRESIQLFWLSSWSFISVNLWTDRFADGSPHLVCTHFPVCKVPSKQLCNVLPSCVYRISWAQMSSTTQIMPQTNNHSLLLDF